MKFGSKLLSNFLRGRRNFSLKFLARLNPAHMGQYAGGVKMGEPQENPHGTPASRTWLVSHAHSVRLKPTPDTEVRLEGH